MNKYIYLYKKKYITTKNEPVFLKEYMIYKDKNTKEKFMILNFYNNGGDSLHTLEFEIKQFNKEGKMIRKADYIYKDFKQKANKHFVPFGKILMDDKCDSIELNIISVNFESKKWISGEWGAFEDQDNQDSNQTFLSNNSSHSEYITIRFNKRGLYFPYVVSICLTIILVTLIAMIIYHT